MKGEDISELMVAIEEMVGEKLDWKAEDNEVVIARKELTLICDAMNRYFYENRGYREGLG